MVSSGAVYGPQPPELSHVKRGLSRRTRPDVCRGRLWRRQACRGVAVRGLSSAVRRRCAHRTLLCLCRAGLPLDAHFAAGNFLRDVLAGKPIEIDGDGRTVRSYLYAADLAVWLWMILFRGAPGRPYNVGSDRAVSIRELATAAAELAPQPHEVRCAAGTRAMLAAALRSLDRSRAQRIGAASQRAARRRPAAHLAMVSHAAVARGRGMLRQLLCGSYFHDNAGGRRAAAPRDRVCSGGVCSDDKSYFKSSIGENRGAGTRSGLRGGANRASGRAACLHGDGGGAMHLERCLRSQRSLENRVLPSRAGLRDGGRFLRAHHPAIGRP